MTATKLPKVARMSIVALCREHMAGCSGLRLRQVVPKIEEFAKGGDQEAIAHLRGQRRQSSVISSK